MAVQLVPIIINVGIGIAGFIAGSLSRQPEINELKQQVKSLQQEVERLHNVINSQNDQIKQLKYRYMALKGWSFAEKEKQKGYIKGSIMYLYALKEYLDILLNAESCNTVKLNKQEIEFYNAFGKMLNFGEISTKERDIVATYVMGKYSDSINNYREPNLDGLLKRFEVL